MPDKKLPQPGEKTPATHDTASEPEPEKPHKHYDIDIYRAWCKQCGICAAFCPKACLSLDEEGNPVVTGSERCTGCGWCELHCPDFAISVRECLEAEPKEEPD